MVLCYMKKIICIIIKYANSKSKSIYTFILKIIKKIKDLYYEKYPKFLLKPDVCVIVASYNYDKFIKETLYSLVNQTLKINDIIVIDDGSTDNSVNIIKEFAKKFDNVKLLQHKDKKNHGLAESIKYAISTSQNKWIAFCESDDVWDKYHFEYLVKKINQCKENGIYASKIELLTNFRSEFHEQYLTQSDLVLSEMDGRNIFDKMKYSNILPTFSAICVPKIIIEKCDFNSFIPQYIDYWLWRQITNKYNVFYSKKSVTCWRRHEGSWDERANVSNIEKFLKENDKILN